MTHWCRDIPRDEAVRAAEDGRPGPLPTLEEAIAGVTKRRPPEPGGGGNVTPGLRTERVTLECVHRFGKHPSLWDWWRLMELRPGESVRVVDHGNDWKAACESARIASGTIADITAERDAAIRERDELIARADYLERDRKFWCLQSWTHEQAANALRARVAELESAAKLAPAANADAVSNPRPISGAGKSAGEETQAASGAAVLAEIADAFGCEPDDDADLVEAARLLVRERDRAVAKAASGAAGTGWLTAEDRTRLSETADVLDDRKAHAYARLVRDFLARSSPPEVVLEDFPPDAIRSLDKKYLAGWDQCMALAKRAISAAGVTVKEVGREL